MKCAICGKKTNWDSSFGNDNFLVCNECFHHLCEESSLPKIDRTFTILETILTIGEMKGDSKK